MEVADLARARQLVAAGDPWSRTSPLHVTGSAVVIVPSDETVLLRWHARQGAWLQVGGHGDPGEDDPLDVAQREAREETGLPDLAGFPDSSPPPLVHVVIVPVPATPAEAAHEHMDMRYLLATSSPEQARAEHEEAPLEFVAIRHAIDTVEPNLAETLRRVIALL